MEEKDYYKNKDGLIVFTESFHKKRGYCCGCGCKHCPYNYEAVKEPRRSALQAERIILLQCHLTKSTV